MTPTGRSYIRLTVSALIGLVCLVVVALIAFSQGKATAERKAEVEVANDDAFYSLMALQALGNPQDEKMRALFQASLDGASMKLSEMCLTHPELIRATKYNLLVKIQKYLKEHGHDSDRNPALRPVDQVLAKIAEANTKMEAIHPDVRQWEEQESDRTEFPATTK